MTNEQPITDVGPMRSARPGVNNIGIMDLTDALSKGLEDNFRAFAFVRGKWETSRNVCMQPDPGPQDSVSFGRFGGPAQPQESCSEWSARILWARLVMVQRTHGGP